MENTMDIHEENLALASGDVQLAEAPESVKNFTEWCFTNDKTNPAIRQMFHAFYQGAFKNKLGLMHAKDKDGKVHTLIVGVEIQPDGVFTYPLARCLEEDEINNFSAPDGEGGWCDDGTE
jgi:hypothetical protein